VLRAHCGAEGRVYDEISKSCYFGADGGPNGERAGEVVDQPRLGAQPDQRSTVTAITGPAGGAARYWG
jgi:hypothetical protein